MTAKKSKASATDNQNEKQPDVTAAGTDKELNNESEEIVEETVEEAETDASENGEADSKKDEQGSLGKVKREKKDKKDEQIAELNDRVMRIMAEFDNFRKRTEKEKSEMFENGARSVVEKLLPVIDSFERGLSILSEEDKKNPIADGMDKIHKQMVKAFEELGVVPIEAVGKEFDPNLHNAVMHGEDENMGENIISDEFQKGYLYREKVVRHSMVKVVN